MAESLPVTFPTILEFRGAELSGYRWLTNSISHFIKFISAISEVQSRYGGWTVSFHSRMIGQCKNRERSLFANRYDANKTAIATNERHYIRSARNRFRCLLETRRRAGWGTRRALSCLREILRSRDETILRRLGVVILRLTSFALG